MKKTRDDFSKPVKEIIAKRAGYRCSYPNCLCGTIGPSLNPQKAINVGEACHICAASPGGPRYDSTMTPEQRMSAENGIWMCQTHAAEIDRDINRYTVDVLKEWKKEAEERADYNRTNQNIPIQVLINQGVSSHNAIVENGHLYRSLVIGLYMALLGLIPFLMRIKIIESLTLMDRIAIFLPISAVVIFVLWKIETAPTMASKFNSTICERQLLTNTPQELMARIIGAFGEKVLISYNGISDGFVEFIRFKRMSFGGWEEGVINYLTIDFRFIIEYYDPSVFYLHALSTRNTSVRMLSRQGFILQKKSSPDQEYTYLKKGRLNVYVWYKGNSYIKKILVINCSDEDIEEVFSRYVKNDSQNME